MTSEILYQKLITLLRNKGFNSDKVELAYATAQELHANQFRKSGEPYIIHPLNVSLILADLNFEIDVICAALLHDVIEDCNYSKEMIEKKFGANVAEIVDSVSSLKNPTLGNELFEDENFSKFSTNEKSFKKLMTLGKKNTLGFYIKFADRLHNLSTIGIFNRAKQMEKVRETEQWIIPLTKLFKCNYFYNEINNQCFKILNQEESVFFDLCKNYREMLQPYIDKIKENLSETVINDKNFIELRFRFLKEYEIYELLKKQIGVKNFNKITQGQLNKIPIFDIFLITKDGISKKKQYNIFYTGYLKSLNNKLFLTNAEIDDNSGKGKLVLRDKFNNIFNLYFLSESEYIIMNLGSLQGVNTDFLDDDNTHEVNTIFIRLRTRSDQTIFLPEGSTVLDFAFKIHKELGFSFKYAIINQSTTKFPPYTKLHDNDKVEIFIERDSSGFAKNIAELKWLAYVNTENAKKALIKHFEKKLVE